MVHADQEERPSSPVLEVLASFHGPAAVERTLAHGRQREGTEQMAPGKPVHLPVLASVAFIHARI